MNSKRFDKAMDTVLKNEGGYVFNPADKGGETKYGISKRAYPDLDIKNLTKEYAVTLYKKNYWEKFPFYAIKDDDVAIKMFDLAVNMGTKKAIQILQRALTKCGIKLIDDGVAGTLTLDAINKIDAATLLIAMKECAADYYRAIVANNPAQQVFLKGWLNRACA